MLDRDILFPFSTRLGRGKAVTAALLLAGALLAGVVGALRVGVAAQPAAPAAQRGLAAPVAEREKPELGEVRGRVVGPDGKPFAGAKLYLCLGGTKEKTFSVRATSGTDGRLAFPFAWSDFEKGDSERPLVQVMAVAEGYGCDWDGIEAAKGELTLRLVKDVPIAGPLVDREGKPVAGAKVRVWAVSRVKDDDLGPYLGLVRKGMIPQKRSIFPGRCPVSRRRSPRAATAGSASPGSGGSGS